MSCHGPAPVPARTVTSGGSATTDTRLRVLLVGGPNVGKSTLFNALTGARQRTVNAPGTTVELATGTWRTPRSGGSSPSTGFTRSYTSTRSNASARSTMVERAIVDLPGTYSLLARSADEQVTADAVRELADLAASAPVAGEDDRSGTPPHGVAIVVLDATALTRSLYLLAQVAETGVPVVVALTMLDVAAPDSPTSAADPADLALALRGILGVPVIPVDSRNRADGGLRELALAVDDVAAHPLHVRGIAAPTSSASPCCCDSAGAGAVAGGAPGTAERPAATSASTHTTTTTTSTTATLVDELAHAEILFAWVEDVVDCVVEQVASGGGAAPDGVAPGSATAGSAGSTAAAGGTVPRTRRTGTPLVHHRSFSDRVDTVLLNAWAGVPVFLAVVWLLFELTTRFAAPLNDLIDRAVNGPLASALTWFLELVGLGGGWLQGLLIDGLLAGVGTVLTFLPVMAVIFLALGVLEDSGYLARAAFVADRAMRALGLDGRALLPLIVGFGCNLPALAATRTLPSSRQRMLTGLLIPLTSCSARLTVYVLLAGAFFPEQAGTVIFLMYLTSVALVLGGGLLLRKTAFRDVHPEPLVLVLPPYQRPHLRSLGLSVRARVGAFVVGAGKIIVATMLVVWLLMAVPVTGQHAVGDVPVNDSLYGRVASGIAPVLAPAGFGNDHAAAALVTGFVAKEVVVGSFAQSYAVEEPGDPSRAGTLGERLRDSFEESSGGHGAAAALAFMVFVLAYTPCVATLAEQKRLFGWRPTASAVGVQLVAAWLLAVLVFQVGARL